ncbi:hypothetical protein PVK06_011276 [Gossypium arboreum]|uniref:Putative plant transposon protein domain-containing protein n=1 Tax=Gossypium arboreum TaxID=29729 RepID=A0ABR0Q8E7_GOSAR|nr:hypothetical protein PVK06_011276 [Gossypium arboreum]
MLKRNFHHKQGISVSQQQDLGKQVYKTISKFKWETFCTNPESYSPSLVREFYANLYDHELEFIFVQEGLIPCNAKKINELYNTKVDVDEHFKLKPFTHSTTVTLDRMYLIHSIVKGRKIDVCTMLHQEIADCTARQTGILVFPSLVMLLC